MVAVWIVFLVFILALLALNLGVFHRRPHVVCVREALGWSGVWIITALSFSGLVYLGYEHHWLGLGLVPTPSSQPTACLTAMSTTSGRPC